ncbi:MAG: lytic transglycosylase domain-containing protein, partial [Paracoccaceae bacterium]|nr:lytic transglycosylase domain-containing protein [Paracoccaceae bacterium]
MFRALGAVVAIFLFYVPAVAQAGFSEAMWSVFGSEWDAAREQVADSDEAAQDVIEWYRLRAGVGSFSEYNAFLHRRSDWPGLPLLKEMGEAAIPAEADAFTVIEYFGQDAPQTGQGALRLAQALRTSGETARADAVIVSAWRNMVLSEELEAQMVAGFAEALLNHHRARQDMLLWRDQTEAALRLNPLVGTAHVRLALARAALIDREEGVDDLIDRVPESLADHPGLAFARFEWRLAAGREDSAVDLMLERSGSARSLGQPEAWAPYRLRMARALMENGSAKKAYAVASQHHLPVGEDYAHLEWLSGYLAFSFLKDPAKALPHFRALRSGATTPISLGRAGYWEAQAAKALGRTEEARAALAFAADFPTSFYGLLAAEELRLGPDKRLLGNPGMR